jgi:hypothetical protein
LLRFIGSRNPANTTCQSAPIKESRRRKPLNTRQRRSEGATPGLLDDSNLGKDVIFQ